MNILKKTIKRFFIKFIFRLGLILLIVLSYQPLWLSYLISNIITFFAAKSERVSERTERNLRRAFPSWNEEKIEATNRLFVKACIDYFFEFLRFSHFSKKQIQRRCVFHNLELIEESLKSHRFVICYSGHFVNFEVTTSLPLHLDGYGMCHLFLSGPRNIFQDWIMKTRAKYGAINIPSANPLRQIIKLNKEMEDGTSKFPGYVFGTLADMDTFDENPHIARMFDRDFEVLTGSERIGRKYNMDFMYAEISRPKRGYYDVTIKKIVPPADGPASDYPYTDEFVRMLEQNIRRYPELWMMWGDTRF